MKGSKFITSGKSTSTNIYYILTLKVQNKPSSNIYFKNLFNDNDIDWAAIYTLLHLVMHNT